jgi:hypothetical protein
MAGIHQIYVYDPSFNVIEINQTVEDLPETELGSQNPDADVHLRHVAIPVQDVGASASFFGDLIAGDAPSVGSDGAVFRSNGHAIRLTHLTSGYGESRGSDPASREPYFTLTVPDLNAVKASLDQKNIPHSGIAEDPVDGVDSLFVHAPSMRLMAVVQG